MKKLNSKQIFTIILFTFLFLSEAYFPQIEYKKFGDLYRLQLTNSMFPDKERREGRTYRDSLYSFEDHYNDSTTLVFVPDYLSLEDSFDIIVYFHGWWNNVDSVIAQFRLIEQLYDSKRNAILVMPEGPKNAPDSFGGKLEEEGRFKKLIEETISHLPGSSIKEPESFNYILAGHSGGYRVMAFILMYGGLTEQIKEVYLFDGLYAHVEKYTYWLDHHNGRFINIYTPDGGIKNASVNLMVSLNAWKIPFVHINSDDFTNNDLRSERIVIIESQLGHNEVISSQNQFKRFLETGK